MCVIFNQARMMQSTKLGDSSASSAEKILSKIQYASTSEYRVGGCQPGGTSRTVDDGLRVFDRVTAAGAVHILDAAPVTLGRKNPLDSFTKLVVFSQKAPA